MPVSIIIPALNEEDSIQKLLHKLQGARKQGHEVIVVDGGSNDKTVLIAESLSDHVIQFRSGRAMQMNAGASQAVYKKLWFLHADTIIPNDALEMIEETLNSNDWGRFDIKLSGVNGIFRLIEKTINLRSRMTGVATGDQGIFLKREIFDSVNGFTELPLMEDINLSRKLKKISKPVCLKMHLITSSRRWEKNGIFSTILLMWRLRFLYWLGVSADKLAAQYK